MLELSVTKVKIMFDGVEYEMRYPSYDELWDFKITCAHLIEKERYRALKKLIRKRLVRLGLPRRVVKRLEDSHVEKINAELEAKKKSSNNS